MNGFLNGRVEVLHPETQTIKAQLGQGIKPGIVNGAGVNFNGVFAISGKVEAATQHGHEAAEFVV